MALKFLIVVQSKTDVLSRVVMLFHRAAAEIESIHMPLRRKKRNDLKITITVDGRHPNARRMAAILEKVVDVLSVQTILRKEKLPPSAPVTPNSRE